MPLDLIFIVLLFREEQLLPFSSSFNDHPVLTSKMTVGKGVNITTGNVATKCEAQNDTVDKTINI